MWDVTALLEEVVPIIGLSIEKLFMPLLTVPDGSISEMLRLAMPTCTGLKSIEMYANASVLTTAMNELPRVPLKKAFLNCVDDGDLTAPLLSLFEDARHLRDFNYYGRFLKMDVLELLVHTAQELENVYLVLTHGVKDGPEFIAQVANITRVFSLNPKLKELAIFVRQTEGNSVSVRAVGDMCCRMRRLKGTFGGVLIVDSRMFDSLMW